MGNEKLTQAMIESANPEEILDYGWFDGGILHAFLQRLGRVLRWSAVKGEADDWAVYTERPEIPADHHELEQLGNKASRGFAKKVVPADSDAWGHYRD